jgi:hypothetical protein
MNPLCFVLMPFGRKSSGAGATIDFDRVYREVILPAVQSAGLEPIRADEEAAGGIIHKAMFERLVLCDYAVADLTTANANVFYELGVRHAAKPRTTILLFAEGHGRLPFDVAQLRAHPYNVSPSGIPNQVPEDCKAITNRLKTAIERTDVDSPLWQLLDGYPNELDHKKTDAFRDRVAAELAIKNELSLARQQGSEAVHKVEQKLGEIKLVEAGTVIDLLLSHRATSNWKGMISLTDKMDATLSRTVLVREQYGFALNRVGRRFDAERVLTELIGERGPSSETNGILGRVYKDLWQDMEKDGKKFKARGYLEKAITTYQEGFEDDWRDAYPGINALTLMRVSGCHIKDYLTLRPVVGYALDRKKATGDIDYWDHASDLELAVLDNDNNKAEQSLSTMLATVKEKWEIQSTLGNLLLIHKHWEETPDWLSAIIKQITNEVEN